MGSIVAALHSRAVRSSLAVRICVPSGLKATPVGLAGSLRGWPTSSLLAMSHKRKSQKSTAPLEDSFPVAPVVTINLPLGLKAAAWILKRLSSDAKGAAIGFPVAVSHKWAGQPLRWVLVPKHPVRTVLL